MKLLSALLVLLLFAAFMASPATTLAKSIYVDGKDGNDVTGDGTEAKPYKTIQKAIDVAINDDEIKARAQEGIGPEIIYPGITIDAKSVAIKRWKGVGKVLIKGADGADGNPPGNGQPAVTATGGAKVHLEEVSATGGKGGNATGVQVDGGDGGPGIKADGAGTVVTKARSAAQGGEGGNGSNGGGKGGMGGNGEQTNGAHIKNLFKAPAKGGKGGAGGENAGGPGGDGGDGGIGAEATNSGTIEYSVSSRPEGGEGGAGGAGTPDGSAGADGDDYYHDGTSTITEIPDEIPTLTEWGLIILALVLLGTMTWIIVRRRKVATVRM